jgi:hypothetical protein
MVVTGHERELSQAPSAKRWTSNGGDGTIPPRGAFTDLMGRAAGAGHTATI